MILKLILPLHVCFRYSLQVRADCEGFSSLFGNQAVQLGIDEAGRGPVLGPMVYGCCFSPISCHADLVSIGFADSKKLNDDKRDELYDIIKQKNTGILICVHACLLLA